MKFIFCTKCLDVVKLQSIKRTCLCGASFGRYIDDVNAEIGGLAIPIGFANTSFYRALKGRPRFGTGLPFDAFVIPHNCGTIRTEVTMEEKNSANKSTDKKK